MTILEYLRNNNVNISAPCGGNGTCGKCMVSVDGGAPLPACRTEYVKGMRISVPDRADDMAVQGIAVTGDIPGIKDRNAGDSAGCNAADGDRQDSGRYGIAIDIGTTTIAGALCDRGSGRILAEGSRINSIISFGADVISRIRAGSEGSGGIMRENLLADIRAVIFNLLQGLTADGDNGTVLKKTIDIIALSGNTTMIHTLMGYTLTSLGEYPYKPVNIGLIQNGTKDILNIRSSDIIEIENSQCVIFPGASAFIGGDIISGLYYLEDAGADRPYAFIDMGTNGEMAIVTRDTIYAASTAAGPVFEGGGISCGTGAVPGAIDHVFAGEDGKTGYSTIGHSNLVKGICGSGIIDTAAVMISLGLCDSNGTFADGKGFIIARYPDSSKVLFTQEDMRQVQLAKAAIAAGFEILCRSAGTGYEDLSALYIAGGLGYAIDTGNAVDIGLIPEKLKDRIFTAGNTSLAGAPKLVSGREKDLQGKLALIQDRCRITELGGHTDFQETYFADMELKRI
ncbi:MAG: DUF4445 domain-containing protein [Lachnospiraceae bacterium]|nr:DUF4445 domain-containing protein [Lachnospiraceae bacterium]